MRASRLMSVIGVFILTMVSIISLAGLPVSLESVRNIPYHPVIRYSSDQMEVRSIRLVNGIHEKGRRYVDQDYEFLRAGQVALGDLNGDGRTDAAVVLYHMNGDRKMTQVAVVLDINGTPVHVASREFGEGTEVMELKCSRSLLPDKRTGQMVNRGEVSAQVSNEKYCNGQGETVTYIFEGNRLAGPNPFSRK